MNLSFGTSWIAGMASVSVIAVLCSPIETATQVVIVSAFQGSSLSVPKNCEKTSLLSFSACTFWIAEIVI